MLKSLLHPTAKWLMFAVLWSAQNTFAAQKAALVIGNSEYVAASDRLKNPVNDAKAVATRLKELGYDTNIVLNATVKNMLDGLNKLVETVDSGGTAIVYYAGHGIQLETKNYLVPVDAKMDNRDMIPRETVQLQEIIDKLQNSGAANRVIIIDACRNDPFPKSFRSGTRGLVREQLNISNGMMVLYAASPNEVAADGTGNHGTFTQAFLQGLNQQGVKLPEMMDDIRDNVRKATNGKQNPYYEGTGLARFMLLPATPTVPAPTPLAVDAELTFWNSIANSSDASDYAEYLKAYPKGKFAGLAQSRQNKYAAKPTSTSKLDQLRVEREQSPNSTSIYDSLTLKPQQEQQLPQVQVRDKPQATTSSSDKKLMKKGMWRDPKTNLVWMRCSLGQTWDGKMWDDKTCKGAAKGYTWQEALDVATAFNKDGGFGGYTDWVVPHIEDLSSIRYCFTGFEESIKIPAKAGGTKIVDKLCKGLGLTINPDIFPNATRGSYWSSSTVDYNSNLAWIVSFYDGSVSGFYKTNNIGSVFLVRSGQ